jgi:glutathione S-transferase
VRFILVNGRTPRRQPFCMMCENDVLSMADVSDEFAARRTDDLAVSGSFGWQRRSARDIVKRGAEARARNFLDVIESHLRDNGPLLLGNRLSAVDLYLVMLARWARPMARPPRSRPNIAKLLDRATALPSVRRAYEQEGIADEIC